MNKQLLKNYSLSSLKINLLILALLGVGLFLRLYQLDRVPAGFHNDEASFLVNAMALQQTGHDEDNRAWPLHLNSFIDPKPALISYLQIPSLLIFGVNTFAARFPMVLLGIFSLWFSYLLVAKLANRSVALVTLGLLVLSPWHNMASRATQEVILAYTLSTLALWVTMTLWQSVKIKWPVLLTLLVSSFLAMYAYHSAKIFLPLSIGAISLLNFQIRQKISWQKGILIAAILLASTVITTFAFQDGLKRFQKVGLLADSGPMLIAEAQNRAAFGHTPLLLLRAVHNKVAVYGLEAVKQYSQVLSLEFLFTDIGQPSRYHIPNQGLLFLIELPLLLIGIATVLINKTWRERSWPMWLIFFIAPIPAALTIQETPSMIRAFPLILPCVYFVAIGLITVWNYPHLWWRWLGRGLVVVSYVWGILYWSQHLFIHQPLYQNWGRNVKEEVMAQKVKQHLPNFKSVVISQRYGQPYVYLALNGVLSMRSLQQNFPARLAENFTIDNVTFANLGCPPGHELDTLYVVDTSCQPSYDYQILDTASSLDDQVGYLLIRYRPILKESGR